MMIGRLRDIEWNDPTEAIPAFLTIIMMPLAVSITEGVAFGVVAYAVLKVAAGRGREVHPLLYVFAVLFRRSLRRSSRLGAVLSMRALRVNAMMWDSGD